MTWQVLYAAQSATVNADLSIEAEGAAGFRARYEGMQ